MITEKEADERATRGADWLDVNLPVGWDARIDETTLDVANPLKCPLSQATERDYTSARIGYGLTTENCLRLGFASDSHDATRDVREENARLTVAWRRLLTVRKSTRVSFLKRLRTELASLRRDPSSVIWTRVQELLADDAAAAAIKRTAAMLASADSILEWGYANADGPGLRLIGTTTFIPVDRRAFAQAARDAIAAYELSRKEDPRVAALQYVITIYEKEATL